MNNSLKGALFALLAFAFFAFQDVILKVLGSTYSPFQILFFAVLLSFPLAILPLLYEKTEANLRPKHPWWMALRTASAIISAIGAVYAFSSLPLSEVYALIFIMPLLITLFAVPMLGERLGWRRIISIIAGLTGVMIVLQPQNAELSVGHGAALTAAVASAFGSVIIRKIGAEERAATMLLINLMATFVVMGILLIWNYKPMPLADLGLVALVAFFGLVALFFTILAYRAAQAAIVSPMQYSQILWATLFGALWFDELVEMNTLIGTIIIIGSGAFLVWREATADTSENQPILSSKDQRPTMPFKPRAGDIARIRNQKGRR